MAPAQGSMVPGVRAEKVSGQRSNSLKKKMGGKSRRKPIALDPMSLTFMSCICKNNENHNSEALHNATGVDYFSAVVESVQPAIFFALNAKV